MLSKDDQNAALMQSIQQRLTGTPQNTDDQGNQNLKLDANGNPAVDPSTGMTYGAAATAQPAGGPTTARSIPPPTADNIAIFSQPGFLDGWLKASADSRANQAQANANQSQTNENEDHSQKREQYLDNRAIQLGMRQSAAAGGYSGVIDFLKSADPERAMQYQTAKDNMDQNMMKTDMMQALLPNEKAKAMVEGYGIIGKMGMAMMNAPESERDDLYQKVKPIIGTVLGQDNTPSQWGTDAAHIMMLGAAQASDANQLYKANSDATQVHSSLAMAAAEVQRLQSQGQMPGQSPVMDAALQNLKQLQNQAVLTQNKVDDLKYAANDQAKAAMKDQAQIQSMDIKQGGEMAKDYASQSKNYVQWQDIKTKSDAALKALAQDPTNPAAQMAVAQTVGMAYSRGKLAPAPGSSVFQGVDNKTQEALIQLGNWKPGDKPIFIKPEGIHDLSGVMSSLGDSYDEVQGKVDMRFYKASAGLSNQSRAQIPFYTKQPNTYSADQIQQMGADAIKQAQQNGTATPAVIDSIRRAMQKDIIGNSAN